MVIVLFSIMITMVVTWFVLVIKLYKHLKKYYPKIYEDMGKPTLFHNNSPKNSTAMLKFIFSRQHQQLNDSYFSHLSDIMLIFFIIYLLIFMFTTVLITFN